MSFELGFEEESRSFFIYNAKTKKTALVPYPYDAWNMMGEMRPRPYFTRQGPKKELYAYAEGSTFDGKEVGFHHPEENWVCIIKIQPDSYHFEPTDDPNTIFLTGHRLRMQSPFSAESIDIDTLSFEFYDLDSKKDISFSATFLHEPGGPAHVYFPKRKIKPSKYDQSLWAKARLQDWLSDHKRFEEMAVKYNEQSLWFDSCDFIRLFKHTDNPDGILFELWEMRDHGDFKKTLERDYMGAKSKSFFYKRAEIDTPVHDSHGVKIYRTQGGLQIEDKNHHEKFFYIQNNGYFFRAPWDAEQMPVEALSCLQVFQIGSCRTVRNKGSRETFAGNKKGLTGESIEERLFRALLREDYELLAETLANREEYVPSSPEHPRYDAFHYQEIWSPLDESQKNRVTGQRKIINLDLNTENLKTAAFRMLVGLDGMPKRPNLLDPSESLPPPEPF